MLFLIICPKTTTLIFWDLQSFHNLKIVIMISIMNLYSSNTTKLVFSFINDGVWPLNFTLVVNLIHN